VEATGANGPRPLEAVAQLAVPPAAWEMGIGWVTANGREHSERRDLGRAEGPPLMAASHEVFLRNRLSARYRAGAGRDGAR
jgi:hypothetical protein